MAPRSAQPASSYLAKQAHDELDLLARDIRKSDPALTAEQALSEAYSWKPELYDRVRDYQPEADVRKDAPPVTGTVDPEAAVPDWAQHYVDAARSRDGWDGLSDEEIFSRLCDQYGWTTDDDEAS